MYCYDGFLKLVLINSFVSMESLLFLRILEKCCILLQKLITVYADNQIIITKLCIVKIYSISVT